MNKYYRLRIRNTADSADDLIVTSSPASGNVHLLDVPTGDGQKLNVTEGRVDIGAYTFHVIDTGVAPVNQVTSRLYDATQRLAFLSRRAYGEWGTDGATYPNQLIAGYVNSCTKPDDALFEITIGESRRIEQTFSALRSLVTKRQDGTETINRLDRYTSILGGPVRGGFGPIKDYGPWKFRVGTKAAGTDILPLGIVEGWIAGDDGFTFFRGGAPLGLEGNRIDARVMPYKVVESRYPALNIGWIYPKLRAHILDASGNTLGYFVPMSYNMNPADLEGTDYAGFLTDFSMLVLWPGAPPAVGTIVYAYLYPIDIGEDNPLHFSGHPVQFIANAKLDAGIAVNAVSVTNTINAIGPDLRVDLIYTKEMKLVELQQPFMGLFGFATRQNNAGEQEFFTTRVKNSALPSVTIDKNVMRSAPLPFDVSEASVINRVVVKMRKFAQYNKNVDDIASPDYLVMANVTVDVDNGDAPAFGDRDITYDLPGTIHVTTSPTTEDARNAVGLTPFDVWVVAIAQETFDRFGRGAPEATLYVNDSIVSQIGDEIVLDYRRPNSDNTNNGSRILQIIQRTNVPDGADLQVLDSGSAAQAAVLPTFTLAANANKPKSVVDITLTNPGAFSAVQRVKYEWAFGTAAPTTNGADLASIKPSTDPALLTSPRVNAGALVAVRARTEEPDKRPGAWTAWASIDLANIPAPTGFAATAVDSTTWDLTWANGDATQAIVVMLRNHTSGETSLALARRVAHMGAGSVKYRLSGLIEGGTSYYVHIKHQEQGGYAGESDPSAEINLVTGGVAVTLSAPQNPRAFVIDAPLTPLAFRAGTYGMDVIATVLPSSVEVEESKETGIGTGVYGAFVKIGNSIASVPNDRTVFTARAPNDRLRRKLRARHIAPGRAPSAYTAVVGPIDPWTKQDPVDYPSTVPAVVSSVVYTTSDRGEQANIRLTFTAPAEVQFKRMEWEVRTRPLGSGTFSTGVAIVQGSHDGPDFVPAQFATEYQIRPITVTLDGVRLYGTALATIVVARREDATPTWGTPVAMSTAIQYSLTAYDDETKRIERWTQSYTAAPDTSSLEKVSTATRLADLNKGDGVLSWSSAVDAVNTHRKTTVIAYDKDGNRGLIVTWVTARATPALPAAPGAWAVQSNPSPATGTIIRRVTLAGTAVAGWKVRTYRNGSAYGTDRTLVAGDITNGYVDVTDAGVSAATTYNYKDSHLDGSSVEGPTNAETGLTTGASATLANPINFAAIREDFGCDDTFTWDDGGPNPSGTEYAFERSSTSGVAGFVELASLVDTFTYSVSAPVVGNRWYRVKARKSGYSDSVYSAVLTRSPCTF